MVAGLTGLRLLTIAAVSAGLGWLWIELLLWQDVPQNLTGALLWYWPVAVGSIATFVVARRGGVAQGLTLGVVSLVSWIAGSFVAWTIWVLGSELGP